MEKIEENIRKNVYDFIILNVFNGVNNSDIKNDTPLISSRIIDSIVALKLVSHIEEKFGIEFEAHEVDQDNLESINVIVAFVQKKLK